MRRTLLGSAAAEAVTAATAATTASASEADRREMEDIVMRSGPAGMLHDRSEWNDAAQPAVRHRTTLVAFGCLACSRLLGRRRFAALRQAQGERFQNELSV